MVSRSDVDHCHRSQDKPPEEHLSNNKEYLSQVNSGIMQGMER